MTLSFKRYALLLGVIVIAIYVALGILGYRQYQTAKLGIERLDRLSAEAEFQRAFTKVLADLDQGADALAEWDELFQQLRNPVYYDYWYAHRILNRSGLDSRYVDLMVYAPNGQVLAVVSDSTLPISIDSSDLRDRFTPDGRDVDATLIRALRRKGEAQVFGYVAVRAKILPSMLQAHAFNRIDGSSLYFNLKGPTGDRGQVLAAATYRLLPTPNLAAMDKLVLHLILLLGAAVLAPTLLMTFFFTQYIGQAVRRVPKVIDLLRAEGTAGARKLIDSAGPLRVQELELTSRSLMEYHQELLSVNASLDEKNQELWDLAHQDVLTGAQNRRAFDNFWHTLQTLNERRARSLRLMLCDVNHFKAINDTYGHEVGDAVLQAIVKGLHKAIRREEQLFRLGGDEFACVLVDCNDQQAMLVASRCEQEVASYPFAEELGIREPVRLSIGISPATNDNTVTAKTLLRQADVAMYHSKRPASGAICIYRESLESQTGAVFSSSINEAVYRVIERGEGLVMHYQPVRHADDSRVNYYESLLRIDHGDGLIFPKEVMPVVESRHLEKELDRAVVAHLLKDLYAGAIPAGSGISINLSAASIVDEGVVNLLYPFREYMPDYKLVVEVTETALITQMEVANKHLMHLRELGFLVALDDFGSGYSSLTYLTSMPVDIVKFDITLIQSLHDDTHRRLVEHLLEFISSAGQDTVAEGVEDEISLQRVRGLGFDYVQGYLWGRPQPLSPVLKLSASPG